MLARHQDGSARLLALGLAVHAVAAGLLFTSVLSSAPEEEPEAAPAPAVRQDPPEESARLVPARAPEALPEERVTRSELAAVRREPAERAATTLAQVLHDPAAEDDLWSDSVAFHARTLDAADAPALRAILADAARPVEEHIAASELLDALGAR